MSWTNENVLEFLELYRQEQHLWDPKHPLHRNRSEVSDAWNRIQATLNIHCSVTDLKKKKESLMTSFRMHLSKRKSNDDYHTTWFAYPLMESFLGGKYECDSTNSIENEIFRNSGNGCVSSQADHSNSTNRSLTTSEKSMAMGKQHKLLPQCQKPLKNSVYPRKRTDETVPSVKNSDEPKGEMDEYDLYGQLLAKKLRKLDEHQRDLAMHEIDNVMFRAKMRSSTTQPKGYINLPSPVPRKIKSPGFMPSQHHMSTNIQYEGQNNLPYQQQPPS